MLCDMKLAIMYIAVYTLFNTSGNYELINMYIQYKQVKDQKVVVQSTRFVL